MIHLAAECSAEYVNHLPQIIQGTPCCGGWARWRHLLQDEYITALFFHSDGTHFITLLHKRESKYWIFKGFMQGAEQCSLISQNRNCCVVQCTLWNMTSYFPFSECCQHTDKCQQFIHVRKCSLFFYDHITSHLSTTKDDCFPTFNVQMLSGSEVWCYETKLFLMLICHNSQSESLSIAFILYSCRLPHFNVDFTQLKIFYISWLKIPYKANRTAFINLTTPHISYDKVNCCLDLTVIPLLLRQEGERSNPAPEH